MPTLSNPSEIAREALRQLAARRMPPSPDNYRALYHEIAGTVDRSGDAASEREFRALLAALPREEPLQQRLARELEQTLRNNDAA